MKTKIKSAKGNLGIQQKKKSNKVNQSKCAKSVTKKTEAEAKRNLESAIKILQYRLNIKKQPHNGSLLSMSQSIYNMIQKNIPQKPKNLQAPPTQDSSQQSSAITGKVRDKQRSYSSHSSSIMQYFKQKFADNATDEQSVERKLRSIQALKKSQEFANKYNSQYNISNSSIPQIGCDIGGKQTIIGKFKKRGNQ